jgi:hypothetical protein
MSTFPMDRARSAARSRQGTRPGYQTTVTTQFRPTPSAFNAPYPKTDGSGYGRLDRGMAVGSQLSVTVSEGDL